MDVKAFNEKVNSLMADLRGDYPAIGARLGRSALSLIRNRIINQGVDHKGKPFGKYSTNPLPYFFFNNKGLSQKADKNAEAIKKAQSKKGFVGEKGISYEQWRKANGLQTNHIDMKFTGETLRDFDVIESSSSGSVVKTVVASKNSIKKNTFKANGTKAGSIGTGEVADHLAERYGDYMSLSEEEQEALRESLENELQTYFDKYFQR